MLRVMIIRTLLLSVIVVSVCDAGKVPGKDQPWVTMHVIPIVEVEQPVACSANKTSIQKTEPVWYVLLSKNVKQDFVAASIRWNRDENWDVFVAPRAGRGVEPLQIFGLATIRSLVDRSTDFFMKTVFNILELMTAEYHFLYPDNWIYTRKDYKYFYQPSYVVPPTYVQDNHCYVFLNLLGKKTDEFITKKGRTGISVWHNTWKSEFRWVPITKFMAVNTKQFAQQAVSMQDMQVNRSCVEAMQTYWAQAFTELVKLNEGYQNNWGRQVVTQYTTDLNEQLAKQAGESWFTFENALYFNNDTQQYGVFGLENKQIRFMVNNEQYNSLEQLRVAVLATESATKIDEAADLKVVYRGLQEKMKNAQLKKLLLDTGDTPLIYASKKDRFYGIGADGRGENHLGRMLMNVRQNERDNKQQTYAPAVSFSPNDLRANPTYPQASLTKSTYDALLYRTLGVLPKYKPGGPVSGLERAATMKRQLNPFKDIKAESEEEQLKAGEQGGSSPVSLRRRLVKLPPKQQESTGTGLGEGE